MTKLIRISLVFTAFTLTAESAVMYSGLKNISTTINSATERISVDIDNNSTTEFQLGSDFSTTHRFDAFGSSFAAIYPATSGEFFISMIGSGTNVDSTKSFRTNSGYMLAYSTFSPAQANWSAGSEGYFGFRYNPSGTTLYGWGYLKVSPDGNTMTLVDWAYESTGASLAVGAIPEPTSCILVALSSVFIAARRRK